MVGKRGKIAEDRAGLTFSAPLRLFLCPEQLLP